MATIEKKVSDLSGEEGDIVTITFAVNGTSYDIDLTQKELQKFDDTMTVYVKNARPTPRLYAVDNVRGAAPQKAKRDPAQTRAIKQWLTDNGYQVPARLGEHTTGRALGPPGPSESMI